MRIAYLLLSFGFWLFRWVVTTYASADFLSAMTAFLAFLPVSFLPAVAVGCWTTGAMIITVPYSSSTMSIPIKSPSLTVWARRRASRSASSRSASNKFRSTKSKRYVLLLKAISLGSRSFIARSSSPCTGHRTNLGRSSSVTWWPSFASTTLRWGSQALVLSVIGRPQTEHFIFSITSSLQKNFRTRSFNKRLVLIVIIL